MSERGQTVTTFFLVRHAFHNLGSGMLAGRIAGVRLTTTGRAQAERLAQRLGREGITAMHASPQDRTRETALAISERCRVAVEIVPALDEVDFGVWAGKSFEELDADPEWAAWNEYRDTALTPAGESIADVARRVSGHIEHCHESDPEGRVVLVTHAEVIRTAILHYLGMPFSAFTRIEIDPASITQLLFTNGEAKLTGLNERVGI